MVEKKENNAVWKYFWTAGGMLKAVQRPDGKVFTFKYDAFGRRINKTYHRREFLYIWDKNVPLHEIQKEELCEDNIITWIFEGFTPTAKLINGKVYSIISDHIGTPILAVDTNGVKVWERELDIYGRVRKEFISDDVANRRSGFMPFLYAGQYYDKETELAYNRFRYYSPDIGTYISQDPIGLAGNNPTLYGYVTDTNTWVDVFGLDCSKNVKRLHKGESVNVKSFTEANELLKKAFPDAKKTKGASPNSVKLSEKDKTFKLDEDRTPVYKKDYLKDENGIIYGHNQLPEGHIHKTNPHINILTSEGYKVSINILK